MAETNGRPQQGMLLVFFKDWQLASQRLEMAQRTLAGAQNDAVLKEARFKGAAELVYGPGATFEYTEEAGLAFKTKRAATKPRKKGRKS